MEVAVGLSFPGKLQDEAIICYLCKRYDIELRILEASFSMSSGWAILKIEGNEEELEKVFAYLQAKEIKIERIESRK